MAMSQYLFLVDQYINNAYIQAGSVQSTQDATPAGILPVGWVPNGGVSPIDAPAITAFYSAGPQPPPLVQQRWQGIGIANPSVYWLGIAEAGATKWQLVGTNLPVIYE
jgi:hypothetical protein